MKKFDGYFQVTITLDMSYYGKLNAISIKIISRNLTLLFFADISSFWGWAY